MTDTANGTVEDTAKDTVFFPGAGSFGREFQLLVDVLKPAAWLIKYPGRYGRGFGIPAESFDGVVQACADQIASKTPGRPVLFGHSFGAYVAYATALRLQETGIGVGALVAVGASAPRHLEVSEQATGTPSDAAKYLDLVDPSALADVPSEDWREIVAEAAVHDLRLLRQFDTGSSASIHCPILAARGIADPLTTDLGVGEWEGYTDSTFSLCIFPGGHSDLLRSPACTSWIREILDSFS